MKEKVQILLKLKELIDRKENQIKNVDIERINDLEQQLQEVNDESKSLLKAYMQEIISEKRVREREITFK